MPTVRLTKKIKVSIKRNSNVVTTKIKENQPDLTAKSQAAFITHVIKQFKLIPHEIKQLNNRVSHVQLVNYPLDGQHYFFSFPVPPTNMFLPQPLTGSEDAVMIDMKIIHNDLLQLPGKLIAEFERIITQRADIENQVDEFEDTLEHLLEKCTTIKQFVEAWPQGEQFIPSSDLQKHYEHEQKQRKRGVYLEDEQLSALNTTLLTSKIT